jgi:hypothetical protein
MSISASDKGMRPGVCTSTNRPATPYDGMMIYETDTDKVAVYDSSAWIYKTGSTVPGLVYITQATPSAVSSVSIDNCFSSAYQNYFVTFTTSAITGTGTKNFTFRLRASGTDSTTNYQSLRLFYETAGVSSLANPFGTDEFGIGYGDSSNPTASMMMFHIFNPFDAVATKYNATAESFTAAEGVFGVNHTGRHSTTSSYDGLTVMTSATSFSGTIRVYGYLNS